MSSSSPNSLFEKYEKLKHKLRTYGKVGVAFSGGVDSSLLLLAAGEVLGHDSVTALHGRSELNMYEADIEEFFASNFKNSAKLKVIELQPLTWPDFVDNDDRRCYYCKRKTYSVFMSVLPDGVVLLDGTNKDDLSETRPGLQVLKEFGVKTPLADTHLNKKEIRFLAKSFGLPNYNTPSNSCLATRLHTATQIKVSSLKTVAAIEKKLHQMGFSGCRVRPVDESVTIELRDQDILNISRKHNRLAILHFCNNSGFKKVLLNIKGRN